MRRLSWMLAAGACLLSLAGCTDSDKLVGCGDSVHTGVIQGRVLLGDVPVHVRIDATDADHYSPERVVEADADSSGDYHLVVPLGNYKLRAKVLPPRCCTVLRTYYHNRAGPPYSYERRDTYRVTADTVITADFTLGSSVATIDFPEELEGHTVDLELYHPWCDLYSPYCACPFTERGIVSGGRAVFRIPALEPGPYQARVHLMQLEVADQALWVPWTRDRSAAASIDVPGGGTASLALSFPEQSAVLRGSVTGSWQRLGTQSPEITLMSPDSSSVIGTVFVQRDGSFETRIFLPGPVKLFVEVRDSGRWYGGPEFSKATVIDLAPGQTSLPVEIVESGLVLDLWEPTYQDIWKARVQLIDPQSLAIVRQTTVEVSHSYPFHGIPNLDPGSYLLRILPEPFLWQNWLGQWYDGADGPGEATPVTVPAGGGIGQVRIELTEGGQIAGTIWYEDTRETFGVIVYLTAAGDPASLGCMHPGEDCYCGGIRWTTPMSYVLRGLPEGAYKVGVWPWKQDVRPWPTNPPPETLWYPKTARWEEGAVLTVEGAGHVPGIDFDLR